MRKALFFSMTLCLVACTHHAFAQGLFWSLPKDGTWIRYEGKYQQVEFRPESPEGDLRLEWIRYLTIKSVGREEAEFNGKQEPCRWIEIKVQTGKPSETGIDSGRIGERVNPRIYKFLVPESWFTGQLRDQEGIARAFIPIVRGYKKIGDNDRSPITTKAIQLYPTVTLVRHLTTLKADGAGEEDPGVGLGPLTAQKYTGKLVQESPTLRSTYEIQLWISKQVPFGVAKWHVKILQEKKAANEPRSAFKRARELTVEMQAQETGTDAKSELATE